MTLMGFWTNDRLTQVEVYSSLSERLGAWAGVQESAKSRDSVGLPLQIVAALSLFLHDNHHCISSSVPRLHGSLRTGLYPHSRANRGK